MNKYRTYESSVKDFFDSRPTHEVNCWCSERDSHLLFTKNKMTVVRCGGCGTVYNKTPPTPKALMEFYKESDAMRQWSELKEEQDQLYKFGPAIKRLKDKNVRSVLDIGCGNGVFLKHCHGMKVLGVEPNKNAAQACRNNNIPVAELPFGQFFYSNRQRFDAVCLWGVLEHVPDPRELLSRIRGMASYVVICVPNMKSLVVEELKEECFTFCPQHLWYFDEDSLKKILRVNEFKHTESWSIEPEIYPILKKQMGHDPYDHSVFIERDLEEIASHEKKILDDKRGYKVITIAS